MKPVEARKKVLDRVAGFVCKDRMKTYSDAEDNFRVIAERWSIHLRTRYGLVIKLDSKDVAAMMIDMKLSRIGTTPNHQDSWDDAVGYATCGAGITEVERDNEAKNAASYNRQAAIVQDYQAGGLSGGLARPTAQQQGNIPSEYVGNTQQAHTVVE